MFHNLLNVTNECHPVFDIWHFIHSETTTLKPEDLTEGGITEGGVTEFPGQVTVGEKAEEALSVADRELTTQEPTTTTPKEEVKGKVCEGYSTAVFLNLS